MIREKAENAYRAFIGEKMISIRENHQKEMDRIFRLFQSLEMPKHLLLPMQMS